MGIRYMLLIRNYQYYDFIVEADVKGLIICANNNNGQKEYVLYNTEGEKLTDEKYEIMNADYDFEYGYMTYLLDGVYEEYYNN